MCYCTHSFLVSRALLPQESPIINVLMKAVQYVIQNRIIVSLNYGIPEMVPSQKRLLVFFMEGISLQQMEVSYFMLPCIPPSVANLLTLVMITLKLITLSLLTLKG